MSPGSVYVSLSEWSGPDVYTTLLKLKQIVKQKKDIRADAALSDEAKVTL
ncbi:MAG: hypothetical protein ACK55Z_09760 [bacterium]